MNGEPIVLDTPQQIRLARMSALRAALKLEVIGLRRSRGPSAFKIIKREFGLTGNREAVLTKFSELIEKEKELL